MKYDNIMQQSQDSHTEDIAHILTECSAYSDIRGRIFPEFRNLCEMSKSGFIFSDVSNQKHKLCQFILDPSSFNLSPRISMNDPYLSSFFQLSNVSFLSCLCTTHTIKRFSISMVLQRRLCMSLCM